MRMWGQRAHQVTKFSSMSPASFLMVDNSLWLSACQSLDLICVFQTQVMQIILAASRPCASTTSLYLAAYLIFSI